MMAMHTTANGFRLFLLAATFCLLACLQPAMPVAAQAPHQESTPQSVEPDANASSDPASASDTFAATLEDCRSNLHRVVEDIRAAEEAGAPVSRFLTAERELWERLQLVTLQRKSVREDIATYRRELTLVERQEAERDVPTSFLQVDGMRDELESERHQLKSLQLELQTEKRITLAIKQKFEESEQVRRRADERFELSGPADRAARNRERVLANLQSRALSAELEFHREQSELLDIKIRKMELKVGSLEGLVQVYASQFQLTREELEQRLELIDQMEMQVRQQLAEVNARLHASMQTSSEGAAAAPDTVYQVAREESQLFQRLLAGAGEFKDCWRRRYALSNGQASASEIARWREEIEQTQQRVSQIVEQLGHRTQQRRELLSQINRNLLSIQDASEKDELARQAAELHRIVDVYGQIQVLAASGERLCQRLIDDLKSKEQKFSLREYSQLAATSLRSAWEYELTTIDDEPITVRKIVFGLILMLCGYYFSRVLASALAYRVCPRFGVTPAGAAVIRSVLFYLFVTAFGFASLEIVNVPLTVFAFLGGAVAIGVGFGSQNLINNFISGLILLVERPIRIGDLVNVDGIDANVEHIGARSTRVRTGANLEILVPNSKFLENNVTNWTLSDTRTRTSVSVGVAYGSQVRRVAEILNEVIRNHNQALSTPEPIVLFQDFADSSLVFEVHFWIHMKRMMDGAKIRSEVRLAIDDAFREAGIVIAFPQRDIHLDMSAPLEVRLSEPTQFDSRVRRAA
jgi:small-conductance mechanosensitive channel